MTFQAHSAFQWWGWEDKACGKFLSLLKLIKLNLSAVLQMFHCDQKLLQKACLWIIF